MDVRSQGDPLWKPFNCELIDLIVPKMPELLWYYRTRFAVSLWVNNELIDNMLQFRDRREQQDKNKKQHRKMRTSEVRLFPDFIFSIFLECEEGNYSESHRSNLTIQLWVINEKPYCSPHFLDYIT